jgi:hypothetical protein
LAGSSGLGLACDFALGLDVAPLPEGEGRQLRSRQLAGAVGVEAGAAISPRTIDLQDAEAPWPLAEALQLDPESWRATIR